MTGAARTFLVGRPTNQSEQAKESSAVSKTNWRFNHLDPEAGQPTETPTAEVRDVVQRCEFVGVAGWNANRILAHLEVTGQIHRGTATAEQVRGALAGL